MPPLVIDLREADDRRDVVHRAVQTLAEGGLVVFPTETVYGVGASARSVAGIRKIFEAKGRSQEAPLALAIKSAEEAMDYVPSPGRIAERLARRCWPGPITLVMEHSSNGNGAGLIHQLPAEVREAVAPNGTVGLRVPANDALTETLQMLAGPIALTSANQSGQPPAVSAAEAVESLGDHVTLVLDGGNCHYGQASTVVKATAEEFCCLREGVVSQSALTRLSSMIILLVCTGNTCRSPMAEVIARKLAAEKLGCTVDELEQRGIIIASAGIAAAPGCAPSAEAVAVMQEKALDLESHASQPLTEKLVRHADVIFTLTGGHRQAILRRWPDAAARTHTLRPDHADISDPIGGPISIYRECAQQIETALRQRIDELELK
ncbi:MAG: L-threonylcarbamoyladenylate synthase [Planctomycetota bacterium]